MSDDVRAFLKGSQGLGNDREMVEGVLHFHSTGLRKRCFEGVPVVLTRRVNIDHIEYILIAHHPPLRLRTYFLTRWSVDVPEFE